MAGKREIIEPHEGDKRYVRRDESGQVNESDDLNRSLSSDNDRDAMRTSELGKGDRGDRTLRGDQSSSTDSSRKGSSSTSGGSSKSSKSSKSSGMRGAAGRRNKGGMGGSSDSGNR